MRPETRFFIVTGGPGSGKSTLLAALATHGVPHMPEAGRAIIQDQVAIGGSALPWANRMLFAELMLGWDLRSWREARERTGPTVFDRGVPDVVGYLELCGLPVPTHTAKAADTYRYAPKVFVAPPWPEIFGQDAERRQGLAEAEATYHAMVRVYARLGYDLVPLPRMSVDERARFLLAELEAMPK